MILYDRLVSEEILELAGPQAVLENVGKEGFGPQVSQEEICDASGGPCAKRAARLCV